MVHWVELLAPLVVMGLYSTVFPVFCCSLTAICVSAIAGFRASTRWHAHVDATFSFVLNDHHVILFIAKFRLVFIGMVILTHWPNLVAFDVPLTNQLDTLNLRELICLRASSVLWPCLVFKNDTFTDFVGD